MGTKVLPFQINIPPLRVDGFAWYPHSEALENYLKFTGRFGDAVSMGIKASDERFIYVPRAICPEPEESRDFRANGNPITCAMSPDWKPRDNQLDIIPQIHALVEQRESFILQAGTGIGKTVLAQLMITGHKVTTLVVVDQENIQRQWRDAILKCTDITESEIGYIQGDVCQVQGKKVVIAMLQSVHKPGRYPAWVYRYFGMIIFDECHVLGATEFSKVCGLFPARIRLGLSATPKRQDGLEKIFFSHIGPVLIKKTAVPLIPKVIMVETQYKLPMVTRRDPVTMVPHRVKLPHTPGRLMEVYKSMANCDLRNKQIANLAKMSYDAGRNVIIFTDLKDEHHTQLENWLINAGIPQGDIGRYTGGMSEEQQNYNSARKVVLCTYKATAKAVDCPWWDTAIFGTPHSDVAQICGRVLREHPNKQCVSKAGTAEWDDNKKCPVIFDLVDFDSAVLQGYTKSRLDYYRTMGAVIAGDMSIPQRLGYKKGGLKYAPK